MKPDYEHIHFLDHQSFQTKHVQITGRTFRKAWHFHPEIEICYTKTSHGQRLVGSNVQNYQPGDLVIFGENLPHGYITEQKSKQVVIQLKKEFLGHAFLDLPEIHDIQQLFNRAAQGIQFYGHTRKRAIRLIHKLVSQKGLNKLLTLLSLLQILATGDDYRYISNKRTWNIENKIEELKRVNQIFSYVSLHFKERIEFQEMAALVNLSQSAFCKFMKRHFHKTFSQLLNEMRINHACQLLIHTDKNVKWICFDSGFNDLAYFSRSFHKHMGYSPTDYRKKYSAEPGLL